MLPKRSGARVVESRSPAGARALDDVLADPPLLAGVGVVVHAAAVRHSYGVDSATYGSSNVTLVERTLRAAAQAGVARFVLVSSVSVYGFPMRLPITEEHPYAPRTLFAATKVEAEMRARRVAKEVGIELVIVRPTIVYGPGDRNGVLQKMASMIRSSTYRVVGSGDNVLHHAHVDDVVEGIWLAVTRPEAAHEHFILAGPETTTLARLSELVARDVGRPLPKSGVPAGLARALATMRSTWCGLPRARLHVAGAAHQSREARRHDTPGLLRHHQGAASPRFRSARRLRGGSSCAPGCGEWPALARAGASGEPGEGR